MNIVYTKIVWTCRIRFNKFDRIIISSLFYIRNAYEGEAKIVIQSNCISE